MTGPFPARAPLSARTALLTYEPYYGLKEKPFSLSVDPRFLYKSRSHAPIFDDLLAGIRRREGLIVLTGDIGTGKTTLCRAVLEELDRKTFSTFVPDPFVSREDLLKMLLVDFGVMSVDDLKSGRLKGASRPDLSYPLYEFLNSLVPLQAFAVLIIDEAQNLSIPLLEEIRILSDLEAPEKLLQVVLVGQLEFRTKLKLPEMRQVDQRVSVRCNLEALSRDAVVSYIEHRLHVAGGSPDRVVFAPSAIDLIYQRTAGVPRLINLISDRSLHRGYLTRTPIINADIVRVAMIDLGIEEPQAPAAISVTLDYPEVERLELQQARIDEGPPSPAATVPGALSVHAGLDAEEPHEEIVFEEHDLVHADHATLLTTAASAEVAKDEQVAAAPPAENIDRPLLFETRGTWTGQSLTGRRWRRRTRRLMIAAIAVAIIAFASYWQTQWDDDVQSQWTPETPPSPYESFALKFHPKRVADQVPLTADVERAVPDAAPASSANPVAAPPAGAPGAPGIYAIDVALFSTAERASRLLEVLKTAGYTAYVKDLDLGARGHLFEVVAGPFPSRDAADAEAAKIRTWPGYKDARVVSSAP